MRMSVGDLDIWRSAHVLIEQHGPDAAVHAAMKADALLATGDVQGAAVWKQIVRAINILQRKQPPASGTMH